MPSNEAKIMWLHAFLSPQVIHHGSGELLNSITIIGLNCVLFSVTIVLCTSSKNISSLVIKSYKVAYQRVCMGRH